MPRKVLQETPVKILQKCTHKIPDTFLQRGQANGSVKSRTFIKALFPGHRRVPPDQRTVLTQKRFQKRHEQKLHFSCVVARKCPPFRGSWGRNIPSELRKKMLRSWVVGPKGYSQLLGGGLRSFLSELQTLPNFAQPGLSRSKCRSMSETPTTTTSQKSIAIHLQFVLQCSSKLYCNAFGAPTL